MFNPSDTAVKLAAGFFVGLSIGIPIGAAISMPEAHADPDTVGAQAHIVCAALYVDPTVSQMERQVDRLMAAYTVDSENKVMWAAMHTVCPEFQYLALAAFSDKTGKLPPTAADVPPMMNFNPGRTV